MEGSSNQNSTHAIKNVTSFVFLYIYIKLIHSELFTEITISVK